MRAAIRFESPDRLPVMMGSLACSDAHSVGLSRESEWTKIAPGCEHPALAVTRPS
jgi:hypothetical protein